MDKSMASILHELLIYAMEIILDYRAIIPMVAPKLFRLYVYACNVLIDSMFTCSPKVAIATVIWLNLQMDHIIVSL